MAEPKIGENRGNAGKGRPKGALNKTTATIKEMIVQALDEAGGVDYLVTQARQNPGPFMTLVGKVLPTQVVGDTENPLTTVLRVELVAPEMKQLPPPEIELVSGHSTH